MPYVKDKKSLVASFDRIKYIYYRGAVLKDIVAKSEPLPKDYECLLQNLFDIEMDMRKSSKNLILTGKYKSFNETCVGGGISKLLDNLYYNFGKSIRMSKKIKIYYDTPEKDMITKIYPSEKDTLMYSYRPAESKNKFYSKMIKFADKLAKNPFKPTQKFAKRSSKKKNHFRNKKTSRKLRQKIIRSLKRNRRNSHHKRSNSNTKPFSFFDLFRVDETNNNDNNSNNNNDNNSNNDNYSNNNNNNDNSLKTEKERDIAVINSMSSV